MPANCRGAAFPLCRDCRRYDARRATRMIPSAHDVHAFASSQSALILSCIIGREIAYSNRAKPLPSARPVASPAWLEADPRARGFGAIGTTRMRLHSITPPAGASRDGGTGRPSGLPAANDEPWSAVAVPAIVVAGAGVVVVASAGEVARVIVIV